MSIQPSNNPTAQSPAPRSNSTVNPHNMFASAGNYKIDEAFQEAGAQNHSTMGLVTDEFNKYGTKSLDTSSYTRMDEWTQSKVAQNQVYVINYWVDNLAKGINGRELLEMSDRATVGKTNYYREGLKQIIDFIPDETKNQTITQRDYNGNPTDQQISIKSIINNTALLEKYINDPALKSAIISAGKALKTSNAFNDAIRYDKQEVSFLGQLGAAAHLGGTTAGVVSLTVGAGKLLLMAKAAKVAAVAAVVAKGGAAATTVGTGFFGTTGLTGMAAFGGFLFSPLGIGLMAGLAVVALAVALPYISNTISEFSQYRKDGRNDDPSGTWFSGKDFACSYAWLTGINAKEN